MLVYIDEDTFHCPVCWVEPIAVKGDHRPILCPNCKTLMWVDDDRRLQIRPAVPVDQMRKGAC